MMVHIKRCSLGHIATFPLRRIYQHRDIVTCTAQTSFSLRSIRRSSSNSKSPVKIPQRTTFKAADRLAGRTSMISGASSGIGYAVAERFLQEGARRVILVGRSHERLVNAAKRLSDVNSSKAVEPSVASSASSLSQNKSQWSVQTYSDSISLLVGDISKVHDWVRELEKGMEDVDILVNAAGISLSAILARTSPEDITQTLKTNLEGTILASRAFLRASTRAGLKKREVTVGSQPSPSPSKCIINISSLLALKGGNGTVAYAASKAGLLGLTRSVAVEAAAVLKDVVVRSNVILPGYIETPMIQDFSDSYAMSLKQTIPLHRFGDPSEVADAAVFLAENEYANNCVLNIDGGLSAV